MIFNLVVKDFILIKKHLPMLAVTMFILPTVVALQLNTTQSGFIIFFVLSTMIENGLFSQISSIEDNSKGPALLCATPYTRKMFVEAKYLFLFFVFMFILFAQIIISFFVAPLIEGLTIGNIGIAFLVIGVMFSIFIPIQLKFGYETVKYILYLIIITIPFIFPAIIKWIESRNFRFPSILLFPKYVLVSFPYLLTFVITIISMLISINIYRKKEL